MMIKSGVRCTEFWLAIGVVAAASVMLGLDRVGPEMWAAVVGAATGGYQISRGLAKTAARKADTPGAARDGDKTRDPPAG